MLEWIDNYKTDYKGIWDWKIICYTVCLSYKFKIFQDTVFESKIEDAFKLLLNLGYPKKKIEWFQ